MWKTLFRVVVVIGAISIGFQVADRVYRRGAVSLPSVPQPNGYETVVQCARKLTPPPRDLAELSKEEIRALAETNHATIQELRRGLRQGSRVPLSAKRGYVDAHAEEVKLLKRTALSLGIEAHANLLEGRTNDSARCTADVILLGHVIARGGVVSDAVSGMAIETLGAGMLRAQIPTLDASTCRGCLDDLERAERLRDTPDKIFQTERTWARRSFGLVGQAARLAVTKSETQRQSEFTKRREDVMTRTQRVLQLLAARAKELEAVQTAERRQD